jgi:hypothetical protein
MANALGAVGVGEVSNRPRVAHRSERIAPIHAHRTTSGASGVRGRIGEIDVAAAGRTESRTAEELRPQSGTIPS